MIDIAKIDKNFEVKTTIDKDDIKFYDVDEAPFKVYGLFREDGKYRRIPEAVAKSVSPGVHELHANTAGGRVRFVTDSNYVAINAKMDGIGKMPYFAYTGSIGFDLYIGDRYHGTYVPTCDIVDGFESVLEFDTNELREITINFPLYSNVKNLYVGVQQNSTVKEATPYKNKKPIVYYGSSITQGACASRPGRCYQSIISRKFHYDYWNLGFAGSARAEDNMIDYIKNLDMGVFVFDYDHNAPTVEYLKNTHEKMFKAIRNEHPDLPIIIMSRPKSFRTEEMQQRLEVIRTTYKNAVENGDKNVYMLGGDELAALCGHEGTVDNTHPSDFGFASMAIALGDVLKDIKVI